MWAQVIAVVAGCLWYGPFRKHRRGLVERTLDSSCTLRGVGLRLRAARIGQGDLLTRPKAPRVLPSVDGYDLGRFAIASLVLIVPWLVGLALRFIARSESSTQAAQLAQAEAEERQRLAQSERAQAQQIADLREEQARLARDVHDVVGHSLAVILAQAESAAYLPDADTAKMREVLDNVAGSARQSLREVREVLSFDPRSAETNGDVWNQVWVSIA